MVQTKARQKTAPLRSAFWDTSAIVPLCCFQPQTRKARQAYRFFPRMIVWWATGVECSSALFRLEREQELSAQDTQQALQALQKHRQHWAEITPTDGIRSLAERLLRAQPLRAADALQLSAALVWCASNPRDRTFVCGDGRLLEAAEKVGFNVIKVGQ